MAPGKVPYMHFKTEMSLLEFSQYQERNFNCMKNLSSIPFQGLKIKALAVRMTLKWSRRGSQCSHFF